MCKGIIYKATNTFNGKVYIGQTIAGLAKRRQQHLKDARADEHNEFHTALYQFPNNFEWSVIDTFEGDKEYVMHTLNVAEEYHILKCNSNNPRYGYNATQGGYSSDKFADYIKRRMESFGGKSRAILQYDPDGNFVREFSSLNAVAAHLEKPKLKAKMLLGGLHYGYIWRVKTSNNFPRKIASYEMATGEKPTIPILAYDAKGDFFGRYPSPEDAGKATDIPTKTIQASSRHRKLEAFKVLRCNARGFYFFREPDDGRYPSHIDIEVIEPKKRKNSSPADTRHPILQYGLDGKFIARFPSVKEAADATSSAHGTIITRCRQPLPFKCNRDTRFIFRDDNGSTDDIEVIPFVRKPPKTREKVMEHRIIQYSLDGDFIKVWESAYKASTSGVETHSFIYKQMKGIGLKHKPNFQWRYYTEDYPQKIDAWSRGKDTAPEQRSSDPITELSWSGEVKATYCDLRDAVEKTGLSASYICNVIAGRVRRPKRRFKRL